MIQTYQALINTGGSVRLLQNIEADTPKRALLLVFDEDAEDSFYEKSLPYLLSESILAEDWNKPEEDEAWAYLQ